MVALIPLVPGVAAAINGLVGVRFFSRRTSGLLASAAMVTAFRISSIDMKTTMMFRRIITPATPIMKRPIESSM